MPVLIINPSLFQPPLFFPLGKNDCSRDKQLLELSNDYLLFPLIAGVSVSS